MCIVAAGDMTLQSLQSMRLNISVTNPYLVTFMLSKGGGDLTFENKIQLNKKNKLPHIFLNTNVNLTLYFKVWVRDMHDVCGFGSISKQGEYKDHDCCQLYEVSNGAQNSKVLIFFVDEWKKTWLWIKYRLKSKQQQRCVSLFWWQSEWENLWNK